jgi:hypothetical protein
MNTFDAQPSVPVPVQHDPPRPEPIPDRDVPPREES